MSWWRSAGWWKARYAWRNHSKKNNTSSGNSRLLHLWEEGQSWCLDKQRHRVERHGLMCKWLYFDALCVAQQYTEFLPYCPLSLSTIYSISFQKKEIMYHFLFNSQGSIVIMLKLSQSPEAFQSFFTCWYNLSCLLHFTYSLSCLSVHWQMHLQQSCSCLTSCIYLAGKSCCCALEVDLMHVRGWIFTLVQERYKGNISPLCLRDLL